MKYYKTSENFPVRSNNPMNDWIELSKIEYEQLCKKRNDQMEADRIKEEEEMKPIREREQKIRDRMRKIAEDQLIEEGEIK